MKALVEEAGFEAAEDSSMPEWAQRFGARPPPPRIERRFRDRPRPDAAIQRGPLVPLGRLAQLAEQARQFLRVGPLSPEAPSGGFDCRRFQVEQPAAFKAPSSENGGGACICGTKSVLCGPNLDQIHRA